MLRSCRSLMNRRLRRPCVFKTRLLCKPGLFVAFALSRDAVVERYIRSSPPQFTHLKACRSFPANVQPAAIALWRQEDMIANLGINGLRKSLIECDPRYAVP